MEEHNPAEGESAPTGAGDTEEGQERAENVTDHVKSEPQLAEGRAENIGVQENVEGEQEKLEGEQEKMEGEQEKVEGEQEKVEGEQEKVEGVEGGISGEATVEGGEAPAEADEEFGGLILENEEHVVGEGEEEQVKPDDEVKGEVESKTTEGELLGEEEQLVEEPPPDPTAPYNLTDSSEALKLPFQLRPDQLMEVETLWEMFQDYTPAYAKLDQYITPKELIYMLKALLLTTYTPEQTVELIEFCVRPPHPKGYINFEQFLKIVTIRQRDFVLEEQIRQALNVFDPQHSGTVSREEVRDAMKSLGFKFSDKIVNNFIKEVDLSDDGTLGIEDIVGTMCIDLNEEDMQMLRDQVFPPVVLEEPDVEKWETKINPDES